MTGQVLETATQHRHFELFPVPVMIFTWPEAAKYRDEMIARLLQYRADDPGINVTNVEGWHSKYDLPGWPEPAFQKFIGWAAAMATIASKKWCELSDFDPPIDTWRMVSWGNINPPGGAHNFSHHHIRNDWNWSASYYLKIPAYQGDSSRKGRIILEDKYTGISRIKDGVPARRTFVYQPAEGELVMFPSWLYHSVEPHDGADDRISVAMNLASKSLEDSRFWAHKRGYFWRNFPAMMRPIAKLRGSWDQTPGALPPGYDIAADRSYLVD